MLGPLVNIQARQLLDNVTEVLAEGLANLAHGLGMLGIAEGVETEDQAALLLAMGWTHGQGWLFGRPTPDPA